MVKKSQDITIIIKLRIVINVHHVLSVNFANSISDSDHTNQWLYSVTIVYFTLCTHIMSYSKGKFLSYTSKFIKKNANQYGSVYKIL
mgnify:CR=1 FL=1